MSELTSKPTAQQDMEFFMNNCRFLIDKYSAEIPITMLRNKLKTQHRVIDYILNCKQYPKVPVLIRFSLLYGVPLFVLLTASQEIVAHTAHLNLDIVEPELRLNENLVRLREVREEGRPWSVGLENLMGISRSTFYRYTSPRPPQVSPDFQKLMNVADYFRVSVDSLLYSDPEDLMMELPMKFLIRK